MRWILCLGLLALQDPPALVERLGSDDIAERADAELRLKDLGARAVDALRGAVGSENRELAARAGRLLRAIELRGALPPALLREFPGCEDRLTGHPEEWTSIFSAAASRIRERAPGAPRVLGPADLDPLLPGALRGARSAKELSGVMEAVDEFRLRGVDPALREFLRKPSPELRAQAARSLISYSGAEEFSGDLLPLLADPSTAEPAAQALRARDGWRVLPEITRLLSHEKGEIRAVAARLLGDLRHRAALPTLRALLKDPDLSARLASLHARRALGDREGLADLIALVGGPDVDLRETAAFLVVEGDEPEVHRAVVDWIGNPHRDTLIHALLAAGRWRIAAAVPGLLKLVGTGSPAAGFHAAVALGRIGDPSAIPPLRELLRHERASVRASALTALGGLKAAESLPDLEKLLADPDASVRRAAMKAIASTGGRERLPAILPLLRDPNPSVREETVDAVRALATREQAAALLPMLQDAEERIHGPAQRGILALKPEGALDALLGRLGEASSHLPDQLSSWDLSDKLPRVRTLLEDPRPRARENAAALLGLAKDVEAVPALRRALVDAKPEVRSAAVRALLRLKAEGALEAAIKQLDDRATRRSAAGMLALGGKAALPALEKLALDPDVFIRSGPLMDALVEAGGKDAIPCLLRMLEDPAEDVRSGARWRLIQLDPAAMVPEIIRRMEAAGAREWRGVAHAASHAGHVDALPGLLNKTLVTIPEDRAEVIDAVARVKLASCRGELREALKDPAPKVAGAAAEALAAIEDAESLPVFRALLSHTCAKLRESAARALCRFGESDGARVLIEERVLRRFILNRVAQPAQWKRLAELALPGDLGEGSLPELLARLAERLGIPIEVRLGENEASQIWTKTGSVLEALESLGADVLLDGDGLRVLGPEAGMDAWRRWWTSRPK